MIRMTNEKWQQNCLIARPAVQFRGFFPEVSNPKIVEIAQEIKETYNDYLKRARSLEDLKDQHRELLNPYFEVHSTTSQKVIYLTRLERFGVLNSEFLDKGKSSLDLRLVNNNFDPEIPNPLLAMATFNRDGKIIERPIGAVALSSIEEYNLKADMKLTQAGVEVRSGITQERINGIYRSLNEYVEMVHQEHPEGERQALATALWQNAHTRDEYQTKKALLAFKLFPNEVIKQLEELQFRELKVVGLHFPTNEYGNKQWKGEEVDCAIAIHPIPDKMGQLEDKRVIKVEGKVLAPLTAESPALAVGTQFKAAIISEASSGVIATTAKGNTLKIGQIKNFAYREREWQKEEGKLTVTLVKNGRGKEMPLVTVDGNAMGVLERESEMKLKERNLLNSKGFTFVARLENSPSTTARVQVQPETVLYPWQQKEQEKQLEAKRTVYREKYEAYTSDILKNSAKDGASRQEIDIEVAVRAYADTQDPHEVATILSQSDTVREWRAAVPHSRSWEEYLSQAKDYVRVIQSKACNQSRQMLPEKQLDQ
jgi:hypothetical protein